MADDTLTITIDDGGRIIADGRAALRRLASRPGRYRLVPSSPNLVILERIESTGGSGERLTGHILLSGEIARIGGLVDVIQFVHSNQWSGQLAVLHHNVRKVIYFKHGDVATAASNVPEDRIGAILYRYGMITQEQLEETVARMTQESRFGQLLVESGVISAHDLYQYVRKQIEEIFYSVLAMRHGEYYFYRTAKDDGPPAQIQLSTKALLFEGVRRIDEMSYFREKLPSSDVVLVQRHPDRPHKLPPREARVLALVDGQRDVAEISRASHLGEFETTKMLYQLVCSGHVQMSEPRARAQQQDAAATCLQIVDAFNLAYKEIWALADSQGRGTPMSNGIGSFFESATEFAPLFVGVQISTSGEVDRDLVLANLNMAPIDEKHKIDYLYRGLTELLGFEIFIVGEASDHSKEQALHARLREILHDVTLLVQIEE